MSNLRSPSRLKPWSFFIFFLLIIGSFSTSSICFGACEFLSANFSFGNQGWTGCSNANWSLQNGTLDVQDINSGSLAHAAADFHPSGFFSVDVDIDILNSSDSYDKVGVYFYADAGDVFFHVDGDSGDYTTDGVAVFYYPETSHVTFLIWDILAGEWALPQADHTVSGAVHSIGISMVADGAIIRVNGQDTNLKLGGDFSFGPSIIDTLWLLAAGTDLHARFDNICASSYEVADFQPENAMPMPNSTEVISTALVSAPVTNIDPAQAVPLGFGPAANGGSTFSLNAGISGFAAPADLYVGLQSDVLGPTELYLFAEDNSLHLYSADGLVKWRSSSTGGISSPILGDIPVFLLPAGTYNFYFFMTPAGRMDVFRLWTTQLVLDGTSSDDPGNGDGTDKGMEEEIRQNIDLILGVTTSGLSEGLTELTELFSDENVVTISPAELSLSSLLSGTPITITANFGSGYTTTTGSVLSGNAQLVVSDVVFEDQEMGAAFSGTFNNIVKDGVAFVNGQVSGALSLTPQTADSYDIAGHITFDDFQLSGMQQSGTIQISGVAEGLDLSSLSGRLRLTFSHFISGDYTINSGTVDLVVDNQNSGNVEVDLQTSEGPVNMNVQLTIGSNDVLTMNSVSPGTVGEYTVSINNITLDEDRCAQYPCSGTVSFTKNGITGVVTFTGACDGTYGYDER